MDQMEFKDNRMEIERINNKKLLEEIKYIVVRFKQISYIEFQLAMNTLSVEISSVKSDKKIA